MSLAIPYGNHIRDYLLADGYVNYGQNGVSFSKTSPVNGEFAFENVVDNYQKADLIVFMGGTNDFGTNVSLDNFKEAVRKVFRKLRDNNPDSKIVFITPIHRKDEDSNGIGLSLLAYKSVLKEESLKHGFVLLDGYDFKIDAKNEKDCALYIYDGVHLNDKGQRMLADFIIEKAGL